VTGLLGIPAAPGKPVTARRPAGSGHISRLVPTPAPPGSSPGSGSDGFQTAEETALDACQPPKPEERSDCSAALNTRSGESPGTSIAAGTVGGDTRPTLAISRMAARRYNNAEATDITLLAWGLNKTLHRMLDAAGADLHRQGFLAALRSGREFASNVFPPLRCGTGHPFGATQAHLLEADCTQRRFKTSPTFVSSL